MPPRERARRIAYIPQIHPPTFGYTVLDTVLMGAARQLNAFQQPGAAQIRQADEALEQVGAAHLRERNFAHLSGGEQQLVLIARALAQKAEVLMMDEPTSALDYGNQLRILQMVRRLAAQGYTVILSTHNPQHALTFATTLLALHGGTAAALGPPAQVLTPELMETLYGVRAEFLQTAFRPRAGALCGGLVMFQWNAEKVRFMEDAAAWGDFHARLAAELAPYLPRNGHVCDAGCGTGIWRWRCRPM